MSNDTETAEQELKELETQIEQVAEAEQAKAAQEELEPSPEPEVSTAPEAKKEPETTVTPPSPAGKPKDDPLEWAQKKGFRTPEDMARELLRKEQEFHAARQKRNDPEIPPPPPSWNPMPQPPAYGYGYPPPPPSDNRLAQRYGMDPEDFDKIARLNADITRAAIAQERSRWEAEMADVRRTTAKQKEFMNLMQDPLFRDERVQQEIHAVLDSNPNLFERDGWQTYAFKQATENLLRKTLQQGLTNGNNTPKNMPPVTAGGGNGSSFSGPRKITEREFNSWSLKEQEDFLNSGGKRLPKRLTS